MTAVFNFSLYALVEPTTGIDYFPRSFEAEATKLFREELKKNKFGSEGFIKNKIVLNSFNFGGNNQVRIFLNAYLYFAPSDVNSYIDYQSLPEVVQGAFIRTLIEGLDWQGIKEHETALIDITFK